MVATGGAVVAAPERSAQTVAPFSSAIAARPAPATSARSPSGTTGSVPAMPVSTRQRTPPSRGRRLVTTPASSRTSRTPSAALSRPDRPSARQSTSPVFGSSARTAPSRVATYTWRLSAASGATTASPTSVFQVAMGGKIGGRGAGRLPEQPDAARASRSKRAARRDKSRTIQRRPRAPLSRAPARDRGAPAAGGIIAAPARVHAARHHPHPRLRLAVHPAHRPPAARAAGLLRDPAARRRSAESLRARQPARASCSRAAPTACTSARRRAATRGSSSSACPSSGSATACSS